MVSVLVCSTVCERKTRWHDMQKIRLGHSLLCVCVSAIATDTPLHCLLDFQWVLFLLSALRVGWRIVFLMLQMSNVNGIEHHAQ